MLIDTIFTIMKKKYNKFCLILPNLSIFDNVFLLKLLSSFKALILNQRLFKVKLLIYYLILLSIIL
jgi:hypothetical protein